MATEELIDRLLHTPGQPTTDVIDALHALLDDSTIEAGAEPIGITEAADLVGLTANTLRYYEQLGLVRPGRTRAGYRAYSVGDLRRLVFLTRMRLSGMTMGELRKYIALVELGERTVNDRRRIMLDQLVRIEKQMRELTLALEATKFKIRTYGGAPAG